MKVTSFSRIVMVVVLGLSLVGFTAAWQTSQALASPESGIQAAQASSKASKPSATQLKAFKKASGDFSLELFQRCVAAKGKNANVTVAPLSVMNVLAVAANGADGKTAAQMRKVLGDGASISAMNKNLKWFNGHLVNSKRAKLDIANAIWYHDDKSLKMNESFIARAKKFYEAGVTAADFADPSTVGSINSWVAKKTHNMIKKVIDGLQPDDRIILVNAMYFDAKWMAPFEKDYTKKGTFTTANGQKHKVKMMHSTEHRYLERNGVVGFVKPYAKGYSYVALLPKKGTSLKSFVKKLDGNAFRKILASESREEVHVTMPKYSVTYCNDGMEQQLSAMGMPLAFSAQGADFSKMGKDTSGNLYIGAVVHKTKVDVDEDGTKAAAVSAAVMKASCAPVAKPKVVKLNRPFVYAIIDNSTKIPLFIGTVNNIGK